MSHSDKNSADEIVKDIAALQKKAVSRRIVKTSKGAGGYERHVIICTGDGCCKGDEGKDAAKALNKRLKVLEKAGHSVYVTKTDCLKICKNGPLMVVYPDGIWYGCVTADVAERIADEHLAGGAPVAEYVFAESPLTPGAE